MSREIDKFKIGIVLFVSTLLFVSGFLFSDYLTNFKVSSIESAISDVGLQTTGLETEYDLLFENPCSYAGFNKLTNSLDSLGQKLVFTDDEKSAKEDKIEGIKQNYFLLEVRHLLLVKKLNKECSTNYTTILYFYSDKGDCEICKAQGPVLTIIKETNPDVMIYSFDSNSDFSLVSTLKEIYQAQSTPSLVIDDNLYEGLQDQRTVLLLLKRADGLRQQEAQSGMQQPQ